MKYKIDHIGYLTGDISQTSKAFGILGYSSDNIVNDDIQQTRICFLHKEGEVDIELVEPYEKNKTMQKMLTKRGVTPYHICYEVNDIDAEYNELVAKNWTALFRPVEAPAFCNRKICYFWNSEIGFIELVNIK